MTNEAEKGGRFSWFTGPGLAIALFYRGVEVIVAIKRAEARMPFTPSNDDRLNAGDQLVLPGDVEQLEAPDVIARGQSAGVGR